MASDRALTRAMLLQLLGPPPIPILDCEPDPPGQIMTWQFRSEQAKKRHEDDMAAYKGAIEDEA